MQFSLIPQGNGRFSFQVLDESDLPILNSPLFFSRESCIASIRGFTDQMQDPDAINIINKNNNWHFELKDEAGEIWMESLGFESREVLESKLNNLQKIASGNTSFEVSMRKIKNRNIADIPKEIEYKALYDLSLVSPSKEPGFHPVQSKINNKHYVLFNNDEGAPILYSRPFSTPDQRDKRIRSIIKYAQQPGTIKLFKDSEWTYFVLKGNNGKEIARSANFPDVDSAESALVCLQEKAPAFLEFFLKPPEFTPKAPSLEHTQDIRPSTHANPFYKRRRIWAWSLLGLSLILLIFLLRSCDFGYSSSALPKDKTKTVSKHPVIALMN